MDALRHERNAAIAAVLKSNPGLSKRRTAMILYAEYPGLFASVEAARSSIRSRTGCSGERSQQLSEESKKVGKAYKAPKKQQYAMPKSKAKPWETFTVGAGTIAVLSDIHFPKHDEKALQAAVDHIKSEGKVDTVLLNGDIADAEEFGSWAKSPKAIDTENSVEIVRQGLLWIMDQFPDSKIVYKFGNHEERLDRYCWGRAPELVGLPHISWEGLLSIDSQLNKIPEMERIVWVKDQRPVSVGKLTIFHGHELPKGLTNAVNPARGAFLRTLDSVMVGHHHRPSSHPEYNWRHEPINCWSIGCLCDLTPEYARINKWAHGHAIVDTTRSGAFSVYNYKQLKNGEVVTA